MGGFFFLAVGLFKWVPGVQDLSDLVDTRTRDLQESNKLLVSGIAERKRAEEMLRASEARLKAVVDNSPAAIFLKDAEGRYSLVNREFETRHGMTFQEMRGKTVREVFPKELADHVFLQDIKVLETGKTLEIEETMDAADGTTWNRWVIKFPVFGSDREIEGIGGVIFDITERKMAEERLRQTDKMEALGQLASGISHELNNLLQPILMDSTPDLWSLPEDSPDRLKLDRISLAARNARDIVRGVLSFARQSESGDGQPPKRFVIAVRQGVELAGSLLPKTIDIAHDIPDHDGLTTANASEVVQVMANLLTNAADAMDHIGEITVSLKSIDVDVEKGDDLRITPGPYFLLSVVDKGSGMLPEIKQRCFEPFYTTKDIGEGTGLGLSIAYGMVRRWGGAICIDSEVDVGGTTVDVYVPIVASEVSGSLEG